MTQDIHLSGNWTIIMHINPRSRWVTIPSGIFSFFHSGFLGTFFVWKIADFWKAWLKPLWSQIQLPFSELDVVVNWKNLHVRFIFIGPKEHDQNYSISQCI